MTYEMEKVLSVIRVGRENSIHQDEIKFLTGYSKRDIRYIIQALRVEGVAICSNTYDGYWLASNKAEVDETIIKLRSQINTLNNTISGLISSKTTITEE